MESYRGKIEGSSDAHGDRSFFSWQIMREKSASEARHGRPETSKENFLLAEEVKKYRRSRVPDYQVDVANYRWINV
jgi:hypothetical protein